MIYAWKLLSCKTHWTLYGLNKKVSCWVFCVRVCVGACVNHIPLFCMIKSRTSLDCDKFPYTRVASSMASVLELISNFNITEVQREQKKKTEIRQKELNKRRKRKRKIATRSSFFFFSWLTLGDGELTVSEYRAFLLVEGQVVDGGSHIHQQLLAFLHRPQLCVVPTVKTQRRKTRRTTWTLTLK